MTRISLLQICASDDPNENLTVLTDMATEAVAQNATMIFTPEVTNCVSASRTHQVQVLRHPDDDPVLSQAKTLAKQHHIWINLGSLAVKTTDPDGRFANRSYMINPDGDCVAEYDKIHMFDVTISDAETYEESAGYRPGTKAVIARTALGKIGMTICYDIRFPLLYQSLTRGGAQILTVPSAFSPVTGAAHWHSLLRARAIETGCFVIAAAQTGQHDASRGKQRSTYGHSLVVAPWGEILLDAGTEPGVFTLDIDLAQIEQARTKIPSIQNARDFTPPQ